MIVIWTHARVARMVSGLCIVGHIKGSIRATNTGKIIQYSTTQSWRPCLGSITRKKRTILLMTRLAMDYAMMIQSGGRSKV